MKGKSTKFGGYSLKDQQDYLRGRSKENVENAKKNLSYSGKQPLDLSSYGQLPWYKSVKKSDHRLYIIAWIAKTDHCPAFKNNDVKVPEGRPAHYLPIYTHKNRGINNQHTLICPASNLNIHKCTDCEKQSNYAWDSDEARELKAVCRPIYVVIDASSKEEFDKGFQLFTAPFAKFEKKLQLKLGRKQQKDEALSPWDPEQGIVIEFYTTNSKHKGNEYVDSYDDFDFVKDDVIGIERALEAPSLDEHMQIFNYEEMKELEGAAGEVEKEDTDDSDKEVEDKADEETIPGTDKPYEEDKKEEKEEKPDCYSKQFEADDKDCIECSINSECEKAMVKEEEPKKPAKSPKGKDKKGIDTGKECPVEGGEFGKTTDDLGECNDCNLYKFCAKEFEANFSK